MTYLGETLFEEGGWERRTVWYGGLLSSVGQLGGLGAGAQHYSRTPAELRAMQQAARNNAAADAFAMQGAQNAWPGIQQEPMQDRPDVRAFREAAEAINWPFWLWLAGLVVAGAAWVLLHR